MTSSTLQTFQDARPLIRVDRTYMPRPQYREVYEQNFGVYKQLYRNNRQMFRRLNKGRS